MVVVDVSKYKNFDKALQVFRTKVRQAHVLELLNSKSHFISSSEKRRRNRIKKTNRRFVKI